MNDNLTPWFPGTVKPVRPGVYQRKLHGIVRWYCCWNGKHWTLLDTTPEAAAHWTMKSLNQDNMVWRGLASKP